MKWMKRKIFIIIKRINITKKMKLLASGREIAIYRKKKDTEC